MRLVDALVEYGLRPKPPAPDPLYRSIDNWVAPGTNISTDTLPTSGTWGNVSFTTTNSHTVWINNGTLHVGPAAYSGPVAAQPPELTPYERVEQQRRERRRRQRERRR